MHMSEQRHENCHMVGKRTHRIVVSLSQTCGEPSLEVFKELNVLYWTIDIRTRAERFFGQLNLFEIAVQSRTLVLQV